MTNTFQARLVCGVKNGAGTLEEKEEIITVFLEDWIKDANFGEGVVQHVINLGLHNKFVEVPPGRRIFIYAKKVHKLCGFLILKEYQKLIQRMAREKLR